MSRASLIFTLPLSPPAVGKLVSRALAAGRWKVLDDGGTHFLAREQIDLLSRFFRHPSKIAVFLHEQSEDETRVELRDQSGEETRVELHGSIFGIGPLQKSRVRKTLAAFRGAIEDAAG